MRQLVGMANGQTVWLWVALPVTLAWWQGSQTAVFYAGSTPIANRCSSAPLPPA